MRKKTINKFSLLIISFILLFISGIFLNDNEKVHAACLKCSSCGGKGYTEKDITGTIEVTSVSSVGYTSNSDTIKKGSILTGCSSCGGSGKYYYFASESSRKGISCNSNALAIALAKNYQETGYYTEISGTTLYTYKYVTVNSNYKEGNGYGDHYWSEIHVRSKATCTEDAIWSWKCKYCGTVGSTKHYGSEKNSSLSYLDAPGHNYEWAYNNAKTRRIKKCTRCKDEDETTIQFEVTIDDTNKNLNHSSLNHTTGWYKKGSTLKIIQTADTGYHFGTSNETTSKTLYNDTVTKAFTKKTATVTANSYPIYLKPNGGDLNGQADTIYWTYNSSVKSSVKIPTRDGYKFLGYYAKSKNADGKVEKVYVYNASGKIKSTNIANAKGTYWVKNGICQIKGASDTTSITLYADWKALTYTATYKYNVPNPGNNNINKDLGYVTGLTTYTTKTYINKILSRLSETAECESVYDGGQGWILFHRRKRDIRK